MNAAVFAHPEWLSGLVWIGTASALSLAVARWLAGRRRRRLLGQGPAPSPSIFSSDTALFVAIVAIAVALLGPRIGERSVLVPTTGVDVVFLVDVSRSMDAQDVPPSRLDRARRSVEEILGRLEPGDRAALAAFAGRGLLLTPLTPDHGALLDLLSGFTTTFIEPASSDIGDGIRAAVEAFEAGSRRPRVVFVASDGEDSRRGGDLGAAAVVRNQARVIAAALGSEAGSHVPDGGRPLRDREGTTVVSHRQVDRLARLAAATGGESFIGDDWGRIDFDRAAAVIRRDAVPAGERVERRVAAVRFAPFAALAFVVLLVEGLPLPAGSRPRGVRRIGKGRHGDGPGTAQRQPRGALLAWVAVAAPLLVGAAILASAARGEDPEPLGRSLLAELEARVRTTPDDARAHLDLGVARLERGRSESAARSFLAAAVYAREAEVVAVAYYDLGVAALTRGDLETARDAFFDALSAAPSDGEARFNLEWTLQALERRPRAPRTAADAREAHEREASDEAKTPLRADPREAPPELRPEIRPEPALELPSLSADQRRRLLERAADDPRQWLRATARSAEGARGTTAEPAW